MEHDARDGSYKVDDHCTLPMTGLAVVQRIVTNLCVFDVTTGGLVLRELAPGITEDEVRSATEPHFVVALEDHDADRR
jgi:acyl CoA:acetate/3-ketoacid CoA transferase beta subunit